jgi:hypothetical protein
MASEIDRPLGNVLQDIIKHIEETIRSEIRLAKAELTQEGVSAARAAALWIAGGVLGLYAVGLLLLTVVYGLATVLAPWLSSLLVAVLVAIAAIVLIKSGSKRMKQVHVKPERTITSVKENVQWVKDQSE